MKTLIWVIIIAALIFGGWHLYKKYSSKPAEKTEETAAAPAPAKDTAQETAKEAAPAPAPAPTKDTAQETSKQNPNSGKGIKNWRPVKKVIDLSNQHNKDLENNM
jgi:predicted negative regulator of RcsB-dependent stress response